MWARYHSTEKEYLVDRFKETIWQKTRGYIEGEFIFIMLILPIKVKGRLHQVWKSDLISASEWEKLSEKKR